MKKTMFLALAVLGMVLGSIAVVQPAYANCDHISDPYGCEIAVCVSCIFWSCPGDGTGGMINEWCDE
jgi:hypothetical protein